LSKPCGLFDALVGMTYKILRLLDYFEPNIVAERWKCAARRGQALASRTMRIAAGPVPPGFAGPHQDIAAPPLPARARPPAPHRSAEYDAIMAILAARFG
jgi:hypothetical protein